MQVRMGDKMDENQEKEAIDKKQEPITEKQEVIERKQETVAEAQEETDKKQEPITEMQHKKRKLYYRNNRSNIRRFSCINSMDISIFIC